MARRRKSSKRRKKSSTKKTITLTRTQIKRIKRL